MKNLTYFFCSFIIALLFFAGCNRFAPPVAEPLGEINSGDEFTYEIIADASSIVSISGSEFVITTNNCDSQVNAREMISRSRTFSVELDAEIASSLAGKVRGSAIAIAADIEAKIEVRRGVKIGTNEQVEVQREIETPANSISRTTLVWEELWDTGTIEVFDSDGNQIAEVPYRILTTLLLTQKGKEDSLCFEPADTPPSSPTSVPTATQTSTPQFTSTPEATFTPTNTPQPTSTSTPSGQVHSVSGAQSGTAGGDGIGASASSWYSTGMYVQEGDLVSVTYLSGEWWIGKQENDQWFPQIPTDAGGYVGRDGDMAIEQMMAENPDICFELRSAPIGSLIGRIGTSGSAMFIGNESDFVAIESGTLYLRINYNSRVNYAFHFSRHCPTSNGGEIRVRVVVTPP